MFSTTFYSFKGGVGRSLALVNVAVELAKDGNNVAIVDFDLEAPGLQTFSIFDKAKQPKFGLVEFVEQYIASASNTPAVPKIESFLFKANKKKAGTFLDHAPLANTQIIEQKAGKKTTDKQGDIWLMPARGKGSKADPTSIDWIKLYDELDGFFLMEELRARLKEFTQAD